MESIMNRRTVENTKKVAGGGTQRDQTVDIIKGIGIILMVLRHARAPYSDFVLLFHMAVFFIASGFLYNEKYSKSFDGIKVFVIKKIRGLWLPYFFFTVLFLLLNNTFINTNIYTDNPAFLEYEGLEYAALGKYYNVMDLLKCIIRAVWFGQGVQIGGAFWFFRVSFYVQITFCVIDFMITKIIKKENWHDIFQGIVSLIFLGGGYYCHLENISCKGFNTVFTVYSLLWIGNMIKKYCVMRLFDNIWHSYILIFASFCILILIKPFGYISLDGNNMENPLYFLVASLAGWFLLWGIAKMLQKMDFIGNNAICYISVHAIPIIAMHFLAFKIVNAIYVLIKEMPYYMIAAFPVLARKGVWWITYTFAGIICPLILQWALGKLYGLPIRRTRK